MTAFLDQPSDPLAFLLFTCEGEVLDSQRESISRVRRFQTFVNEAGIQQTCLTCDEIGVRDRPPNGLAPAGHTRKTKTDSCLTARGRFFDVRVSRVRAEFHVGDLVVFHPQAKLSKDLRPLRKFNAFRVVGLAKTCLHAHRLVSAPGVPVHVNLNRDHFKRFLGSESALVARTLEMLSGKVFVTSFAPVVFNGESTCLPRTLTISEPMFMDIMEQVVEEKEPSPPPPVVKSDGKKRKAGTSMPCRGVKTLKGDGCAKLTNFFAVDARAVR